MSFTKTVTVNSTQSRFWGLTAFFNPQRHRRRTLLYRIFRERTRQQRLRLLTVELAFGDAPFELHRRDAEILIQLRTGDEGVMWQKERLLNIGLRHLPPECEALVWLDCDVVFENPNWIKETEHLLRRHVVVQPFSVSVRLPRRKRPGDLEERGDQPCERVFGAAYAYTQGNPFVDYMLSGHTGFAWAARRSLFDGLGLYDKMIVGGGDVVIGCGLFGRSAHKFTHLLPKAMLADQRDWLAAMSARVAGSIWFTPGKLLHLWHGHPRRRMTFERFQSVLKHSFNPQVDLRCDHDQCFAWTGNKPALQQAVARHFWVRNEDGHRLRELAYRTTDGLRELKNRSRRAYAWLAKKKVRLETTLSFANHVSRTEKLTLIVMNRNRPQIVEQLINSYSSHGLISDVIVWNNNPDSAWQNGKHPGVKSITCKYDAGRDARWAAAVLAESEHLLIHDDNLLVKEKGLRFLFSRYLRNPHLAHGIRGCSLDENHTFHETFGRVEVLSSPCMMINKRYVSPYFSCIPLFDDLRDRGHGDGDDVVMNYVVRSISGEKNFAWAVPHWTADGSPTVSAPLEFLSGVAPPVELLRNAIASRCMEQLTSENGRVRVAAYLLTGLGPQLRADWLAYHETPEVILRREHFTLSENLSVEKFSQALSLLCRRSVLWNDPASEKPSAGPCGNLSPAALTEFS
jgi:hypothetical protein